MPSHLDVEAVRRRFPALARRIGGAPAVFFDGPAGSQVPEEVASAVGRYLLHSNANRGGAFATSRETDTLFEAAQQALADLFGAGDPGEIVFGPNMTSLTFALSRALAKTWRPGDEIIVFESEHDANYTPWVLAAADAGARVRTVRIHKPEGRVDLDDYASKLNERTRLVAVGAASNAIGTIQPARWIAEAAHTAGALVFLDAVHYAPHALLDVGAWDFDFVAVSAYKFFGPHVGVLWGRRELLETLPAYKVRPAPDTVPDRWMTGTQNHEGIAGVLAAVEYIASLADAGPAEEGEAGVSAGAGGEGPAGGRRARLARAYERIVSHERTLLARLLGGLRRLSSVNVWGIADLDRFEERVPTVAFTHTRRKPRELEAHLAERGIFVWSGNFYALPLSQALGLEPDGMVRVGLLHYNTEEEVDRLLAALRSL